MDVTEKQLLAVAARRNITFDELPDGRWQWAEHPPGMTPIYADRGAALRGLAERLGCLLLVGDKQAAD